MSEQGSLSDGYRQSLVDACLRLVQDYRSDPAAPYFDAALELDEAEVDRLARELTLSLDNDLNDEEARLDAEHNHT